MPVGRGSEDAASSSSARFLETAALLLLLVAVSSSGGGGGGEKPAGQEPEAAAATTVRRGCCCCGDDRGTASRCRPRRVAGAAGALCASLAGRTGADVALAVTAARGTGDMAAWMRSSRIGRTFLISEGRLICEELRLQLIIFTHLQNSPSPSPTIPRENAPVPPREGGGAELRGGGPGDSVLLTA